MGASSRRVSVERLSSGPASAFLMIGRPPSAYRFCFMQRDPTTLSWDSLTNRPYSNIVTMAMTRVAPPVLGEFELLVVLAVMRLGDTAYPLAIADDIEKTTHRKAARPSVLITLNRLEEKGLDR